jgi:hypothetical protein
MACCAVVLVLPSVGLADDQLQQARVSVTVLDQTGAVIPNAPVTLAREDGGVGAPVSRETPSNGVGVAAFGDLAEGRYTVRARFPGFQPATVTGVRARRGREARVRVVLQLEKLDESLTVSRDRQTSALDPRGSAFSAVLTREQIDALPDDPDEMEAVLKALAPPGAVIRVDGFSGGKLPPKSQIRSIRLPRMDMFAAQNHGGMSGMHFIDIMTMPGNGPLRGNLDFNFQDESLNARNPFTPVKGAEQLRQYGYTLAGTIVPNRTSFSVTGGGGWQYISPNLLAVLPDGRTATDTVRQPRDTLDLSVRFDHAINKDHALRASYDRTSFTSRNLGVGGYNLLDRAFDTESATSTLRVSENGPLGRRMFTDTRLQVRWGDTSSRGAIEAPAIRVQDAFTSGGAQQRGGVSTTELEFATDLDYVRGAHSWRTGLLLEAGSYRADDITNYLGTYTFASLADYRTGRPSAFTRRVGDPDVRYSTLQAAAYAQDDWRLARSLLISAGVRYGVEGQVGDRWNLSPRATIAWSPFRNGRLTLRANYGYFYDWIPTDLYKETVLVDGVRQRELNLFDPGYPLEALGNLNAVDAALLPSNRYLWPDDLALPGGHRLALGVERTLSENSRLNVSYNRGWGRGLLRGRNLNTPVAGVRPDPRWANVIELAGDAGSSTQQLNVIFSLVRMDLRRLFFVANYSLSRARTNTAGAFAVAPGGDDLEVEWGPAAFDARHRFGASFNLAPFRNVTMGLNVRGQSGAPYTITTGRDVNGDGLFNDRPAGVGRNSARGRAQWDLGGRIAYAVGFGTPRPSGGGDGPRVVIRRGEGDLAPGFGGGAEDKRYRIEFYLGGQNLLNRANYTAYSFVLTSPFYGRPVAASQPRKLQAGVRFGF